MLGQYRLTNQHALLGCGFLVLVVALGLLLSLLFLLNQERDALRYPNAIVIPDQTAFQLNLASTGMTAIYRSTDNFEKIREWYIQRFNMTLMEEDIGSGCILLEGSRQRLFIERYTFVSICVTAGQQTIFVSHAASFN